MTKRVRSLATDSHRTVRFLNDKKCKRFFCHSRILQYGVNPLPMTEHVWALSLWVIGFCKNKLFCIIFAFFKGTENREPISEEKVQNCENLWMVTIFVHLTNYSVSEGQRWQKWPKLPKISVDDFFSPMAVFFFTCNMLRFHPKSLSPALNHRKCCSKNYEQNQEITKNCEFSR